MTYKLILELPLLKSKGSFDVSSESSVIRGSIEVALPVVVIGGLGWHL